MISKFGVTDIIESLNNTVHCFKTLNKIEVDTTKGAYYNVSKHSYNFCVLQGGVKTRLKFYKDYYSLKAQTDYTTIKLAQEMADAPFSSAMWLKDEFNFTYNSRSELYDVLLYVDDAAESLESFLHTIHSNSDKKGATHKLLAFFDTLIWVLNSNYIIEKLSIDSFYTTSNGRIKINICDINIKRAENQSESAEFYRQITYVFQSVMQILSSFNNLKSSDIDSFLLFNDVIDKSELISMIESVKNLDIANCCIGVDMVNCFDNPNYLIEDFREENRIVVTDKKSLLKGYANYDGVLVTNCIYEDLTNYNEGYAVAMLNNRAGVIDKNNCIIVDFQWDWVEIECEHNLFIAIKDNLSVILNRKSEQISNKKFKFVGTFIDGFSIVEDENDKIGVINQFCEYVINPDFDSIEYCQMKEFKLTLNGVCEKISL